MTVGLFRKADTEPDPEPDSAEPDDLIRVQRRGAQLYLDMVDWPPRAQFTKALLADRPEGMRWRGHFVDIKCANARAIYRVAEADDDPRNLVGDLVYFEGPIL